MSRPLRLASVLALARAQMKGDVSPPDSHPKIIMQECQEGGSCKDKTYGIVLDMSWRWLHNVGGYTNCVGEDGVWDKEYCPDGEACAEQCCVEGLNSTQYSDTYGISAAKDASGVTLKYVPGSRVYLLDESGDKYLMFKLKNKEFTFDIDLSTLPCGTNAALYLIEMAADGGGSDAGAAYGAGYCDAQCPRGAKFIDNEANTEDWGFSLAESPEYEWVKVGPEGKYGACCAEFDILEANNAAVAMTAHPCSIEGLKKCEGEEECGNKSAGEPGWCDKDGCGLIPYRLGEPSFYGPGDSFDIDTTKPFTVVTQFITEDGTDDGAIVDIRRQYIQGGKVIDNAMASVLDEEEQGNSLNDDICDAIVKKFNVTKKEKHHKARKSRTWLDTFKLNGGTEAMGEAIGRGMVMSLSVWDDGLGRMNWLDSEKTLVDEDTTQPGVARGPCKFEDGDPKQLRADNKKAFVTFSNLKMGPIGSTVSGDGTSSSGGAPATPAPDATAPDEADAASPTPAAAEPAPTPAAIELAAPTPAAAEPAPTPAAQEEDEEEDDVEIGVEDDDSSEDGFGDLVVNDGEDEAPAAGSAPAAEEADSAPAAEEASSGSASFTPTQGCEWIPSDDCQDVNEYACGCREANPQGPCTPCNPDSSKKTRLFALFPSLGAPSSSAGAVGAALLAVLGVSAAAAVIAAVRRRRNDMGAEMQLLAAGDEEALRASNSE